MRVQEEIQIDEKKRYVLIDENNKPVIPVFKYLKYLDNIGKAENTLRAYCRHLKLYFQYLKEVEKDYKDVDINLLTEFISWLRNPDQSTKVIPIQQTKANKPFKLIPVLVQLTKSVSFRSQYNKNRTP